MREIKGIPIKQGETAIGKIDIPKISYQNSPEVGRSGLSTGYIAELADYAVHGKWRCKHYKKCHCGLDELCDKIGIPRVPYDLCE